jgi:hypothetical protein
MKNWKTSEMTDAHRGKHLKIRVEKTKKNCPLTNPAPVVAGNDGIRTTICSGSNRAAKTTSAPLPSLTIFPR